MNFSLLSMEVLVWGALVWTLLNCFILLALLLKDYLKGEIW
ncbi:MAG: hypothetical protein AAFY98_08795 [Verrucomicrobiota bacterium]